MQGFFLSQNGALSLLQQDKTGEFWCCQEVVAKFGIYWRPATLCCKSVGGWLALCFFYYQRANYLVLKPNSSVIYTEINKHTHKQRNKQTNTSTLETYYTIINAVLYYLECDSNTWGAMPFFSLMGSSKTRWF